MARVLRCVRVLALCSVTQDIHLYFVRVLLGLSWLTQSWNLNQSPPGGLLRFELGRAASGAPTAK